MLAMLADGLGPKNMSGPVVHTYHMWVSFGHTIDMLVFLVFDPISYNTGS